MPSGLIALLDDVATIAKIAAASVDDVGLAVGKAGTKAAGVVIDDTAVTPRYVTGFTPERELPIIGKIALGSLKNKLFILLPVAMLLVAFAPFLVTPLLMIGGAYLVFEATEKIIEKVIGDHHARRGIARRRHARRSSRSARSPGAIRTDFILSAEIMAIALAELGRQFDRDAGGRAGRGRDRHHRRGLWSGRVDREARRHRPAPRRAAQRAARSRSAAGWSTSCPILLTGLSGDRHRGDAVGRRRHPRSTGSRRCTSSKSFPTPSTASPMRSARRRVLLGSGRVAGQCDRRVDRRPGRRRRDRRRRPPLHQRHPRRADRRPSRNAAGGSGRGNRATGRASGRSSP